MRSSLRFSRIVALPLLALSYLAHTASAAAPVLDPVAGPLHVGTPIALTGSGITPGTVLKVFVATAGGPLDVSSPAGIAPSSATSTSFSVTLPFPWPVADPAAKFTVGNGFVSLQLVRTDQGFDATNLEGAVLLGNDALGVPSVTGIDGTALSSTSSDPSIGLANVETVVTPGDTITIQGSAFASSKVNLFTASGNVGPLDPVSQTSTSIDLLIPADAPIGPGSFQVVNASGDFLSSNAVSAPIGALATMTSVDVTGSTVTGHGSGFNALTVINLFAAVNGQVVNLGGFGPGGTPNLPLTLAGDAELSFTLPSGLDPGAAFVQAINPPFIPYTTSQGDGGSFPTDMVFVPAGTFTMGTPAASGIPGDEQPPHSVNLSSYWIDRTEVTVDDYAACVTDGACTAPDPNSSFDTYCNASSNRPGDHPMNCVNWSQGEAYCAWRGKRYPTEAEWEKAARGTDARVYPWGATPPTCNEAVFFYLTIGVAGCGLDHTWPVGSKPLGASPYGALDLIGNVWEWVHDYYDASYYASSPANDPQGPASSITGLRTIRGDAWDDSHSTFVRGAARLYNFPTSWSHAIGFRCARDG